MSPGGKLTVFMVLALAIFFAIKWVLARILGPYPEPTQDRPSDIVPLNVDAPPHQGAP